jgi:hypothetical protein
MCDFEQVINLFICFSGSDVKGVILQSATPKMVSVFEDDQFIMNVNCSSFDKETCDEFAAADNCSSICKSEYSAKKLSAQVEKYGHWTSMSRNHGSGYYSAEELPAGVLKRLNLFITRSGRCGSVCDFVGELSAWMHRQSNHLFSSSISHDSRSDSAEEFPA